MAYDKLYLQRNLKQLKRYHFPPSCLFVCELTCKGNRKHFFLLQNRLKLGNASIQKLQ